MKEIGLLMPIFALPSKYGIGDFGKEAFEFIDILNENKMTLWNILPLNPIDNFHCPYSSCATNAIEPLYISLDLLVKDGLLDEDDLVTYITDGMVDYDYAYDYKYKMYKKAFEKFQLNIPNDYSVFKNENKWAYLYAVYSKFYNLYKFNWNYWDKICLEYFNNMSTDHEIEFYIFLEYICMKQWLDIKKYASSKNIKIIGDMPMYSNYNSAEVWAYRDNFLLNKDKMEYCSGASPDYFRKEGQKWWHPLYNYKYMSDNNYEYWMDRFEFASKIYDITRIDHFRALDTYYKIPVDKDAIYGIFELGPGSNLLDKVFAKYSSNKFLVEDLGNLRKEVYDLRDRYNLTGMKILQYTIHDGKDEFLDNYNLIVYPGNHDNKTIIGWYNNLDDNAKEKIDYYLKDISGKSINEKIINYTLGLPHKYTVFLVQDVLGLDDSAIWNTPGETNINNFSWKLEDFNDLKERLHIIKNT